MHGTQYSATEQHSATAEERRVWAFAPQDEPASLEIKLFLDLILAAVFVAR